MVIENPWVHPTYMEYFCIKPTVIDTNRRLRGDYFVKPTAYWFVNREPGHGFTAITPKETRTILKSKTGAASGICSEERSMISPEYAGAFIDDFLLHEGQIQGELFE